MIGYDIVSVILFHASKIALYHSDNILKKITMHLLEGQCL